MKVVLQDIEDTRGPAPKPDHGRWIPVHHLKRRRKRPPVLKVAYEKTTSARLVTGPATRKGPFLQPPVPMEEIKVDARDAARRLRESRKSRREKHSHQRTSGEVSHGRRARRGKDHDRQGEHIPWVQDHGDRLDEATFSAPYSDPEFLAKFNSTLGYPGEGPPQETTFTKCVHGDACTKRSHYHRKRGGAAGSSAARGFKERNKKDDPLPADKVTRCDQTLANCLFPGCHFHGTPGEHTPKHLNPVAESLAALPADQPYIRTEATKTPIEPVFTPMIPTAPAPFASNGIDAKHSPLPSPPTTPAPAEDQLTDKALPLTEVEAVLPVVAAVIYPRNDAWEEESSDIEDLCEEDFVFTGDRSIVPADRLMFMNTTTPEEFLMINVDDPEVNDTTFHKKKSWTFKPWNTIPPAPEVCDQTPVQAPPPPVPVVTPEVCDVPPPPPLEEVPPPPPPEDSRTKHTLTQRVIFYTVVENNPWYYSLNRAVFSVARPFAATRLAVNCNDAELEDVVAVNYPFKVAFKEKRGYVSKWARSAETCFLEHCKYKFQAVEDISLTLVDFVQRDDAFMNTSVFDAAGAVLSGVDTRVRGIVTSALKQLALTHSPPPPDVVQSTTLYLTQWKYFSGFKFQLGTVRGTLKPDFHRSGHVLESNNVTRSGYHTSRRVNQRPTRTHTASSRLNRLNIFTPRDACASQ